MKSIHFKYNINSISVKLLSLILLTVGPIAALMIYNNINSRRILLEQIIDTHRNTLQTYVSQIDNQLSTAMTYAISLVINENDVQIVALGKDNASVQYATVRVMNAMKEKILSNYYVDGYFLLAYRNDDSEIFINIPNNQHIATSNSVLLDYIKKSIPEDTTPHWSYAFMDNDDYLFVLASSGDNLYAGSYVRISHLLRYVEPSSISGSQILLLPEHSFVEYSDSLPDDMQLISYPSSYADLRLIEVFSKNIIFDSLPFIQKYTLAISIAMIALFALLLFVTQKIVIIPLSKLTMAMQHIQHGYLEYRLPEDNSSSEIHLLNNTFNHMAGQIKDLKISVYEEELQVQKSQLRNLQMQIKPHFLINSLNMIRDLNKTGKISLANKLIMHTADYFRFMIRIDEDLLPLSDELDHIRAYLDIQSIRYQNHFHYTISVDPKIADMMVPPVMIQNFVENSIKYGLNMTNTLFISIQITSFEKNYFPYARILLSDSGPGYPEEELLLLNNGAKVVKKDGEHIGLYNTIQRLRIMFGEEASYRFYNNKGAVCEYILPATFPESDDEIEFE